MTLAIVVFGFAVGAVMAAAMLTLARHPGFACSTMMPPCKPSWTGQTIGEMKGDPTLSIKAFDVIVDLATITRGQVQVIPTKTAA